MDACYVDIEYISTACNRTVLCADWNTKNVLCFGSSNAVSLLDTEVNDGSAKIVCTAIKHTQKVNCVRWIRQFVNTDDFIEDVIISGSSDNTAIIWKKINEEYSSIYTLNEHKGGITVVDAKYLNDDLYAVTASVDSSIKIWKKDHSADEVICTQTLNLGSGLCLSAQLSILPNTTTPILAVALDDDKIHIFVQAIDNKYENTFKKVISLLGHEDWVRGIDFVTLDSRLLLATCSQDTYIRLWSIEPYQEKPSSEDKIEIKKEMFVVDDVSWAISLDAVLSGHEGWVYSVHWNKETNTNKLKLLSASIDKSLIIWEPNVSEGGVEGVWSESVRVGEVGGSGLGFYGGKISHNGRAIIGHGYTGSFHLWKYKEELSSWEPSVVCGGHFGEVVDIGWEPDGEFLISASTDQTVRIHSSWIKENSSKFTWHEIARPQIHGFDMSCLAIISKYCYASGAEEKVIRTFQAPKNFINNFHNIIGRSNITAIDDKDLCEGASVPSLGLSNKAVYNLDEPPNKNKHVKDQYPISCFVPVDLKEPPTEETLMQNTLWPESYKLYGHGYEVYSLAASPDSKLLASACKATTPQHAAIIIWDTAQWIQKQSLTAHQLTVVQLAFSPDSTMLLSVSRDRRWSLFKKNNEDVFSLIGTTDKSNGIHSRIIWCCAWTYDSNNFLTGSRDGKVVMWTKGIENTNSSTGQFFSMIPPLELKSQSITAVATSPTPGKDHYIAAIGLETGIIFLYKIVAVQKQWQLVLSLDNKIAHHLSVRRLAFRPIKNSCVNKMELASCSDDHMVKIYNLTL